MLRHREPEAGEYPDARSTYPRASDGALWARLADERAASREYPIDPKSHHIIVEINAPDLAIGREEIQQIRDYAGILLGSHAFDRISTRSDLFLVSLELRDDVEDERRQKNKPIGSLWEGDN